MIRRLRYLLAALILVFALFIPVSKSGPHNYAADWGVWYFTHGTYVLNPETAEAGVLPACPALPATSWHGITNAAGTCQYAFTNGDNPHSMDNIFGQAIYGIIGGEVCPNVQTAGECANKPAGYKWVTYSNQACDVGVASNIPGGGGCVRYARLLCHCDWFNVQTTQHSYVLETISCVATCGYRLDTGWLQLGALIIDGVTQPGTDQQCDHEGRTYNNLRSPRNAATWTAWYCNENVSIQVRTFDTFGHVDPANPGQVNFDCQTPQAPFASGCNDSTLGLSKIQLKAPGDATHGLRSLVSDTGAGFGYLNAKGQPATGCTGPNGVAGCFPFICFGGFGFASQDIGPVHEFDPNNLATFPN